MMDNEISILIVEDEGLIAQHIKSLLQGFGYDIAGVFYKYQKAVTAIAELDFDVLITDINLGHGIEEKSGLQIAGLVKKKKDCPIVFLTAFSDRDTIKKAAGLSPSAYLVKPVNAANLFAAVQLAVDNFISQNKPQLDKEEKPDYFFVKQGKQLIKIFWKEVYHLEYVKNYVKVRTTQQAAAVLIRDSLKQVMQDMVPGQYKSAFIKINRSEVITKKSILKIEKEFVETSFGKFRIGSEFDKSGL